MKKYLLILLSIFSINLMANTYIYKGTSSYRSDIRFTWDGKYLYKGTSQYRSDVILSYDGENIYKGTSTYRSDILCHWDGRNLYSGTSQYRSDILCSFDGEYVYKGVEYYARIEIVVELPVGNGKMQQIKTGWSLLPKGKIKLATPFSGFVN